MFYLYHQCQMFHNFEYFLHIIEIFWIKVKFINNVDAVPDPDQAWHYNDANPQNIF